MLLNHGADPTLATYSGQTAVKLAQSPGMKTFLKGKTTSFSTKKIANDHYNQSGTLDLTVFVFVYPEYFTDLEGRTDQDPSLQWDFYSSSVFGKKLKLNTLLFKLLFFIYKEMNTFIQQFRLLGIYMKRT